MPFCGEAYLQNKGQLSMKEVGDFDILKLYKLCNYSKV